MAISNLQTSITNIKSRLYNIQGKLNELVAGVSTDEYADFEIPSNYTLLEYIQANGNCWCNSGYIPKSDTTIYGKFYMASQSSSYPTIFGARNGSPFTLSWYSHNMTDGWAWIRNNVSSTRTGQTKFQNTLVYLDSTENYKTMKFLNEFKEEVGSLTWGSLPTDSRIQHSLYLFVLNNDGSVDGATYCSGYRIHYIKFYENGELVRGYCACLDGNGTPCFYDTVSHTTFYNQGSGSFIAGPEHVKPTPTLPYRELEYIESTGTQYINTGIIPNNHYVDVEAQYVKDTNNSVLFGYNSTDFHVTWYSNKWYYGNTNQELNGGANYSCLNKNRFIYGKDTIFTINGNIINSSCSASSSGNLWILNRPANTSASPASAKIYYFKIYDKSTNKLVRDLIPVQRKMDNVVCMYDKISKTYLENAGTGTFIAGPEVQ